MPYAHPSYNNAVVDRAGEALVNNTDALEYFELEVQLEPLVVVNNWRASHSYPLLVFRNTLQRWSSEVDPDAIVSQRIKRLPAIEDKLGRLKWKLSEVQDIGGCRAIVSSRIMYLTR